VDTSVRTCSPDVAVAGTLRGLSEDRVPRLIVPVVFLASIPVALAHLPVLAEAMWLLTFVPIILGPWAVRRLEAREAAKDPGAA
jgi:hypothetical protein